MIQFEDVEKYLPQYLTEESQKKLYSELNKFPENIDQRLYSSILANDQIVYQGDGVKKLIFVNLPDTDARPLPAFILSNTCDIDLSNERLSPTRIVYAPIFQLEKYRSALIEDHVKTGRYKQEKIDAHIEAIKKQFISHILFLPKGYELMHDSIVFFDRLNNCPLDTLNSANIINERLFSLSDYGFYLFLVKLSIHFTRIREKIKRS